MTAEAIRRNGSNSHQTAGLFGGSTAMTAVCKYIYMLHMYIYTYIYICKYMLGHGSANWEKSPTDWRLSGAQFRAPFKPLNLALNILFK